VEYPDKPAGSNEDDLYRIRIHGILNEGWVHALQVVVVTTQRHYEGAATTTLFIRVRDQAELMGVLARLHGMNFALLAVEQWSAGSATTY
jgi:hypothetical protein